MAGSRQISLLLMGSAMGIPIRRQLAASGLSDAARSSQLGSFSLFRMMGLERAMMYSVLHRSFSRISHSSLHRSRGLSVPELRSHVGKAKWQSDGMANWEQRSERWLDVPIMVKAAGRREKKGFSSVIGHTHRSSQSNERLVNPLRAEVENDGVTKREVYQKQRLDGSIRELQTTLRQSCLNTRRIRRDPERLQLEACKERLYCKHVCERAFPEERRGDVRNARRCLDNGTLEGNYLGKLPKVDVGL